MGTKQGKVSGPMVLVGSLTARNGHRRGLRGAADAVASRARSLGFDVKAPSNSAEALELAGAAMSAAAVAVALIARMRSGSGSNGDGTEGEGS